jgi:hypothetical protein
MGEEIRRRRSLPCRPTKRHYADDGFEFDRLILLGGAYRGLTDVGEVLMTLDAVADGDAEAMALSPATVAQITCALLITSPDHEQFWPGQSEELHQQSPTSTLVRFTEAEGADWHCEPAASGRRDERVFDWIEDVLAATHH